MCGNTKLIADNFAYAQDMLKYYIANWDTAVIVECKTGCVGRGVFLTEESKNTL